jgi:hypothetical protein
MQILVIAVAVVVVLILVLFLLAIWHCRHLQQQQQQKRKIQEAKSKASNQCFELVLPTVPKGGNDEVSTLHDTVARLGEGSTRFDEETVQPDPAVLRAYGIHTTTRMAAPRAPQPGGNRVVHGTGHAKTAPPPSMHTYDVLAPPGPLGIGLDAGTHPRVLSMKPDSPLMHKVRVGHRLVAIDHKPVSNLSSHAVSEILRSQSGHTARILTFAREVAPV